MNKDSSEPGKTPGFQIAAVEHEDSLKVDQALARAARRLKKQGYRLAGALRANLTPGEDNRCELYLEDLSTDAVLLVSQDLGSGSHACRLDDGALDAFSQRVEAALENGADILILNKYGKQEADGRGLRSSIVKAVDRGIPVLVGLNASRMESWNTFCDGAGKVFDPEDSAIDRWLEANLPACS